MSHHVRYALAAFYLSLFLFGYGAPVRAQIYEEAGKKHSWFSFSRPAKDNPTDQMIHAEALLKERQLRRAERAFRSLVLTWPSSPEAPMAQWALARILDQRGKYEDAFDAYQKLMEKYPARFPDHDRVLTRQFEIATQIMNKRRGGFFFGGFEAPERAIPFFEKIVRNAPRSPIAPEAQFLIGEAHEKNYEYELAVVAYSAVLHRYPLSDFAEPAAFARARSLNTLSENYPNDRQAIEEAWAGIMVFLRSFPQSEFSDEAVTIRDRLLKRKAQATYEIARYYDRIAKRPQAAKVSYQQFLEQFPQSPWSDSARERVAALATTSSPDKELPDEQAE
ncbi:MAG TPA: outer membrane protein assembly factor BamD [Kiritimatiellia bacterium]|nr:outer membrane protein assembly factor BamD [Kiritimatiellia bacterium]HMO97931.1 outer membrane protein assembly factor BamD [Kiritimatiellia bacterium]HMP95282.1 outer membrane protein assembly factor BamD [Kiritimatiellia bacterium]